VLPIGSVCAVSARQRELFGISERLSGGQVAGDSAQLCEFGLWGFKFQLPAYKPHLRKWHPFCLASLWPTRGTPIKPFIYFMHFIDSLICCTTRIDSFTADGKVGFGTGFFLNIDENNSNPILITNKHVVKDTVLWRIRINQDRSTNPLLSPYVTVDRREKWVMHPEHEVDLCAVPMRGILDELTQSGIPVAFEALPKVMLPNDEELKSFTSLEDVLVIGYPNSIWDSLNNKPIVRKGITATSIHVNYRGKNEFLIDSAIYPGSSGSPVFLVNIGIYSDGEGVSFGDRIALMGVVHSVMQHATNGKVEPVPINQLESVKLFVPNHLGVVVNYTKILDFERLF
jgi:hypothetical protein